MCISLGDQRIGSGKRDVIEGYVMVSFGTIDGIVLLLRYISCLADCYANLSIRLYLIALVQYRMYANICARLDWTWTSELQSART